LTSWRRTLQRSLSDGPAGSANFFQGREPGSLPPSTCPESFSGAWLSHLQAKAVRIWCPGGYVGWQSSGLLPGLCFPPTCLETFNGAPSSHSQVKTVSIQCSGALFDCRPKTSALVIPSFKSQWLSPSLDFVTYFSNFATVGFR